MGQNLRNELFPGAPSEESRREPGYLSLNTMANPLGLCACQRAGLSKVRLLMAAETGS